MGGRYSDVIPQGILTLCRRYSDVISIRQTFNKRQYKVPLRGLQNQVDELAPVLPPGQQQGKRDLPMLDAFVGREPCPEQRAGGEHHKGIST